MNGYLDRTLAQRAVSLGIVVIIHVALLLLVLTQTGTLTAMLAPAAPVRLLASVTPPPPKPRRRSSRSCPPPDLLPVPVAGDRGAGAPRRHPVPRRAPSCGWGRPGRQCPHFGAASGDAGLGVVATTSGAGGARGRGNLGEFEAAVKRAILSRKVQPVLAWDRRNTCVVNYTATIARDGSLAAVQIDPCAIAEINEAARAAIRDAAPFPPPPELGARTYSVHGTLIFHHVRASENKGAGSAFLSPCPC